MAPDRLTLLNELESVISLHEKSYIEIGRALREIKKYKLYKIHYKTFEEYCEGRWEWTRQIGYEYIWAAEVAENVRLTLQSATPEMLPSLTQAVELYRAKKPEIRQEIIREIGDFNAVSVSDIRKIVDKHVGAGHEEPSVDAEEEEATPCRIEDTIDGDMTEEETREAERLLRILEEKAQQKASAPPAVITFDGFRISIEVQQVAAEIIEAGYRHLARERHPDKGGSTEGMQDVNVAAVWLRNLIAMSVFSMQKAA